VIATEAIPAKPTSRTRGEKGATQVQDGFYEEAAASFGPALERLTRAYEADPDHRRDLLQEIHIALWRSFASFDQRCSLRTWVYRVAHNVSASHVARQYRNRPEALVGLEQLESLPDQKRSEAAADRSIALNKLLEMIQRLKPLDRDVILSYLEGLDAEEIGEITGLSARNVATKIHRIKNILAGFYNEGGQIRD
jgi:RNA polymerase sigma-70 factor (ECF subfamily)